MTPTASNPAFTNRAVSAAGPRAAVTNQRFFTTGSARASQSGGAPDGKRFNGNQAAGQRFSGASGTGGD